MDIYELLKEHLLFRTLSKEEFQNMKISESVIIKKYEKEEFLVREEDSANLVGLILLGTCRVFKSYQNGKDLTLAALKKGDIFGEVVVFSGHTKYPASISALESVTVCFMTRSDMLNWCNLSQNFLENFLRILSLKILLLNQKTKALSFTTIRGKIANLLMEYHEKYHREVFELPLNRKNMADYLGIPRPSLSRELIKMKEENIIDFYQNSFKILDVEKLQDAMAEEK